MYIEYKPGTKHKQYNGLPSTSLEAFEDAGYLLEEDECVIDLDKLTHEQIVGLIEIFDIHTQVVWTDRGAHLYFKKPVGLNRRDSQSPLGFGFEIKTSKNAPNGVTVKRNGVARKVENEGVRADLPMCVFDTSRKKKPEVSSDIGNRNETLFMLKSRYYTNYPNDYKNMLRWVNEYWFSEPLDATEFETVTREPEIIVGEKDGETITADYIMDRYKVVKYANQLFFLQDGEYIGNDNVFERLVYEHCQGQKSRYVEEVIKQISMQCELIPDDKEFKIKFKNGYLYNGKFYYGVDNEFTPYDIKINYNPDAKPVPIVDEYLDQFTDYDASYRKRVLESLAHCLITERGFKRKLARFFIFYGDGGNGKGTLLQVIRQILGQGNCSALSIREMGDERYAYNMLGKLANLGDDLEDEPIRNKQMKVLKNISTCDTIEFRKMRENSVTVQASLSLIFTSNHILKSFEKSVAFLRRIDWMPILSQPAKPDPWLIDKLTTEEALEYWIKLIMEAYFRLYERGDFTPCQRVHGFKKNYAVENDNSIQFIQELTDKEIEGMTVKDIRQKYESWCEENDYTAMSKKAFGTNMKSVRGYHSVSERTKDRSRTIRVYRKIENWQQSAMVQEFIANMPTQDSEKEIESGDLENAV